MEQCNHCCHCHCHCGQQQQAPAQKPPRPEWADTVEAIILVGGALYLGYRAIKQLVE
jgi:hypothetical protein